MGTHTHTHTSTSHTSTSHTSSSGSINIPITRVNTGSSSTNSRSSSTSSSGWSRSRSGSSSSLGGRSRSSTSSTSPYLPVLAANREPVADVTNIGWGSQSSRDGSKTHHHHPCVSGRCSPGVADQGSPDQEWEDCVMDRGSKSQYSV